MSAARPAWMADLVRALDAGAPDYFTMFAPPARVPRRSAVLMLFGPTTAEPDEDDPTGGADVMLTERSPDLRAHPGQVSFPGGAVDPGDDGPVGAALREAYEEVGVDPAGVDVVHALPDLYLSPSRNSVTPVLAWWPEPTPLVPREAEVARVVRAPLATLVDPGHRFAVVHPSGVRGRASRWTVCSCGGSRRCCCPPCSTPPASRPSGTRRSAGRSPTTSTPRGPGVGVVNALDVVLVVVLAAYAVAGLRQGFVVSVLSLAGFLGGAALAMWLLPDLVDRWGWVSGNIVLRAGLLVAAVFVVASAGQGLGLLLGHRIRRWARIPVARAVDGAAGMVVVTVAASVILWFVAGALRVGGPASVSKAVAGSAVLRTIDAVMPPQTSQLFAGFRQVLDREGFPQVFDGLRAEPIAPVAPPSEATTRLPGVIAAARSIVKVEGVATQCRQLQEGSGWVSAAGLVVTNAHVVAGLGSVSLQVGGTGPKIPGRVVVFDPERDLAVIAAPRLTAPPLRLGTTLSRGDDAVVAGFPGGGAYTVDAARVRDEISATGADIYGRSGTVRQVYSLNAVVRPGNSGGPLLDGQGKVEGVVFARSLDDPLTGYALTLAEVRPVLAEASTQDPTVSTGACLVG